MKLFRSLVRTAALTLVALLAIGAVHVAPYGDVETSVSGIAGDAVAILVHNPALEAAAVEVQLTVRLDDDSTETVTSDGVYLGPGETTTVEVHASGTVSVILDGPEPFPI